jgi:hypothetical protein
MNTANDSGNYSVPVRRAKVDSLSLYEVTESELDALEQGGSASLFLNFSFVAFSVAVSFLIAIETNNITPDRKFYAFFIVTLFGFLSGAVLLVLWLVFRYSTAKIVKKIKARMPPENPIDVDASEKEAVDKQAPN